MKPHFAIVTTLKCHAAVHALYDTPRAQLHRHVHIIPTPVLVKADVGVTYIYIYAGDFIQNR